MNLIWNKWRFFAYAFIWIPYETYFSYEFTMNSGFAHGGLLRSYENIWEESLSYEFIWKTQGWLAGKGTPPSPVSGALVNQGRALLIHVGLFHLLELPHLFLFWLVLVRDAAAENPCGVSPFLRWVQKTGGREVKEKRTMKTVMKFAAKDLSSRESAWVTVTCHRCKRTMRTNWNAQTKKRKTTVGKRLVAHDGGCHAPRSSLLHACRLFSRQARKPITNGCSDFANHKKAETHGSIFDSHFLERTSVCSPDQFAFPAHLRFKRICDSFCEKWITDSLWPCWKPDQISRLSIWVHMNVIDPWLFRHLFHMCPYERHRPLIFPVFFHMCPYETCTVGLWALFCPLLSYSPIWKGIHLSANMNSYVSIWKFGHFGRVECAVMPAEACASQSTEKFSPFFDCIFETCLVSGNLLLLP